MFVCSHERSGTHFLMNSIADNSNYDADIYLDFDRLVRLNIFNAFDSKQLNGFQTH